ncbi:MAG TPA: TolC family protein [Candidatus Wunengus sp. YC60]|uniref:TolC family protein n=1 Tax=Candidatus Wunengus sp. YC60 TaxID=3367697 RepID=UPI0040298DEC
MKIERENIFQLRSKLFFFRLWILSFLFLSITSALYAKELTLEEILRIGLQANPEIPSLEERIEAAKGAVVQAGTAPNPDASIRVEDYSPGNGTAKTTLGFTQRLEYPGKRTTRKSIASENVEILKLTLERTRLDTAYTLKKAFYDILLASEYLSMYRQNHAVARELLELVNHRLKQGLGGGFEVAKASVELVKSEKLLKESEGQLALTRTQLNILLNNPPDNRIEIQGKITAYSSHTDLSQEDLIRKAINKHPSILTEMHRIKGLEHNVSLSKLLAKPDVDVGIAGGLEEAGNPDSNPVAEFSISVPLPIWDRKKGAIAQAEGEKKGAEEALKQTQRNITQEVLGAFNKYSIAQKIVHLFDEGILVKTAKTRDIIRQSFESGLLGFLDVVDAQRTYLDAMQNYYQSLYDLHLAEARLEKAIGGSLQ